MILSIDIGGTAVKLGLVDGEGVIRARAEAGVAFDGYRTPLIETALREARALLAREGATIEGCGISATGQIDERLGTVVGTNGKIPGYEGTRLVEEAERALGVRACALNDANAAVLGECFAGAAKGERDVVMVTLGTGVGGGVVCGGRLLTGARGIAGELGHFTLDAGGPPCPCGGRGCYEHYASTTALVRLAGARTGEAGLTGRDVFARVREGDEAMRAVLDEWTEAVAEGLRGLVHLFNPSLVLVGGGVSAQEALLIEPLRRKVLCRVMPRFAEGLRVERARLGNDAGLIGAARRCMEMLSLPCESFHCIK